MTIEKIQLKALKDSNIKDNDDFFFYIVDMKKVRTNKDFYSFLDNYDKKELKQALKGGARYMLAACECNTMNDDSITLQPVDAYNMQTLKELNIKGLSNTAAKIYEQLKDFEPFNGGAVISLGIDYELLDNVAINY